MCRALQSHAPYCSIHQPLEGSFLTYNSKAADRAQPGSAAVVNVFSPSCARRGG